MVEDMVTTPISDVTSLAIESVTTLLTPPVRALYSLLLRLRIARVADV